MSISCATGSSGLLRRVPAQRNALSTYGLIVVNEVCLAGWRSGNARVPDILSSNLFKGTDNLDLGPSCLVSFFLKGCLDRLPPSKSFPIHPYILPFEAVPYSRIDWVSGEVGHFKEKGRRDCGTAECPSVGPVQNGNDTRPRTVTDVSCCSLHFCHPVPGSVSSVFFLWSPTEKAASAAIVLPSS